MSENKVEREIPIQKEDVGRLIGAKGSTIRHMQSQSKAFIKVDRGVGCVYVSGSYDAVRLAEEAIYDILGGRGVVSVWDIDEMSIRFLTRNSWLASLKAELQVDIQIERSCLRIRPLNGELSVAQEAQSRVQARLKDASKLMHLCLRCSAEDIRKINADPTLSQLKTTQGLQIDLKKDDEGTLITLAGTKGIVSEAQEQIQAIIGGGKARDTVPIYHELFNDSSDDKINDLYRDVNEHVIKQFQVDVDLQIGATKATISCEDQYAVTCAKCKLQEILQYYFPSNCAILPVHPLDACEWVCGPDSRYIVRAQLTDLVVSVDKDALIIWCCGNTRPLENYCNRVRSELEKWHLTHAEVYLEDKKVVGRIVGTRGENIKKLQEDTHCMIAVDDMVVKIESKDKNTLREGVAAVQNIITRFQEDSTHQYDIKYQREAPYRGGNRRGGRG